MNAQAYSMIADGDARWVTEDVPSPLGRPAGSFEQFATVYAAFSQFHEEGSQVVTRSHRRRPADTARRYPADCLITFDARLAAVRRTVELTGRDGCRSRRSRHLGEQRASRS